MIWRYVRASRPTGMLRHRVIATVCLSIRRLLATASKVRAKRALATHPLENSSFKTKILETPIQSISKKKL
jgi:hypothetical protein